MAAWWEPGKDSDTLACRHWHILDANYRIVSGGVAGMQFQDWTPKQRGCLPRPVDAETVLRKGVAATPCTNPRVVEKRGNNNIDSFHYDTGDFLVPITADALRRRPVCRYDSCCDGPHHSFGNMTRRH